MELENNIQRLREHYFNMMEHIKLLRELLSQSASPYSVCFVLPHLSKEDIGIEPCAIHVEKVTGQYALNMAIEHLSQHELKEDVPGLFAQRLPGVIFLNLTPEDTQEAEQRIEAINSLKAMFAGLVKALSPNKDVRFEIVSQALPNLIKKSVARKILVAPEHCKRIGFTWKRFYSVRKKTPLEWDEYLENAIKKGRPKGVEQTNWEQAIEIERQILRNNDDAAAFVSRRPLRIAPAMNLTMSGGKVKATTVVAHSPLWVFNQVPTVGVLNDFNDGAQKRQGSEREEQLLIPRLFLYR